MPAGIFREIFKKIYLQLLKGCCDSKGTFYQSVLKMILINRKIVLRSRNSAIL